MATLLISVPGVAGELFPILPIIEALAQGSNRVIVHTGRRYCNKVKDVGAEFIPMPDSCNLVYRLANSSLQVPWWLPESVRNIYYFRSEALAIIPDIVAELEPIIKRERVDCLISDNLTFGATYVAEKLGIPFATISASWVSTPNASGVPVFLPVPLPSSVFQILTNFILPLRRIRQQIGLPARPKKAPPELSSLVVSAELNLVVIHREFIPCKQLQENQVFIGPTYSQKPKTKDKKSFGANLEPGTVLVSSTTSPKGDTGSFRRILESVADLDIPILAASGTATDLPSASELGNNVRLEEFVPFDEVMPYVKAVITHGGFGTVGRALKLGIPMLIISDFGDTVFTGARAAEIGIAYHLPKDKATPKAIRSKLQALLKDRALQERVKVLGAKLRSMNSAQMAANAIENILKNSGRINKSITTAEETVSIL